jgi:hypothetical protein
MVTNIFGIFHAQVICIQYEQIKLKISPKYNYEGNFWTSSTKSGSQSKAEQLQWRRDKVQELYSPSMHVGLATVNKDTSYLQTMKYDVFIYIHIVLFVE